MFNYEQNTAKGQNISLKKYKWQHFLNYIYFNHNINK